MRNSYSAWRPQGTPDWLCIYTVSGRGRFGCRSGDILAEARDLVLIQRGTPHDYGLESTLNRWELLWAHFHPPTHWLPLLCLPLKAKGLYGLRIPDNLEGNQILQLLRQVNIHGSRSRELFSFQKDNGLKAYQRKEEALAMNTLERVFILTHSLTASTKEEPVLDPRIKKALDYMCQNFANPFSIQVVASHSGLSPSRLAHLFREQVGKTPFQFLEEQRLNKGRELLELTQLSISEISEKVGFSNPFYFTLRFKKQTRLSPRAYRLQKVFAAKR